MSFSPPHCHPLQQVRLQQSYGSAAAGPARCTFESRWFGAYTPAGTSRLRRPSGCALKSRAQRDSRRCSRQHRTRIRLGNRGRRLRWGCFGSCADSRVRMAVAQAIEVKFSACGRAVSCKRYGALSEALASAARDVEIVAIGSAWASCGL
eukprot:scaffold10334_cov71-Phaeocystis_antarctica.AAC.10